MSAVQAQPAGIPPGEAAPPVPRAKSAITQQAILEAAVHVLVERGYDGLVLRLVANRAGFTRGALQHHYLSKLDLASEVMDYAFQKHVEEFQAIFDDLAEVQSGSTGSGFPMAAKIYDSVYHRAYLELLLASHGDPDLRAMFLPKAKKQDQIWLRIMLPKMPKWAGDARKYLIARRFSRAVATGTLILQDVWASEEEVRDVLHMTGTLLAHLRENRLSWS